jgi:hypothetical protein
MAALRSFFAGDPGGRDNGSFGLSLSHWWSHGLEQFAQHLQALGALGKVALKRPPGAAFEPPVYELSEIYLFEVLTRAFHGVAS